MRPSREHSVPQNLRLSDPGASRSCVAAQALYMCGRASRPDVPAVDRAIGRRAGQEADKLLLTRHLLAQGLTIRTVLRLDYERLFREGSAYFRYYFRNIWSPEWEKLYAQNGIEQWIAAEKIK
jgi:hypothetical protein